MAKDLYLACKKTPLKGNARDQLSRAALSICLNLSEGSAKQSAKERRRFYYIALGSQREVHCILDLEQLSYLTQTSDVLGASIYRLIRSIRA